MKEQALFAWAMSNARATTTGIWNSPSTESGSSGYSSEADFSDGQTESGDGEPSSLSSSSSTTSSDAESEDIDSQISFLRQKQVILKRAFAVMKEAETYDATRARRMLDGSLDAGSSLWIEAKEVLEDLDNAGDDKQQLPLTKKPRVSVSSRPSVKGPRHPGIDLSTVKCMSASEVGDDLIAAATAAVKREVTSVPFMSSGPWVAEILSRCIPNLPKQATSGSSRTWEIVNDPSVGPLVVPPTTVPNQNRIQLKDAIACTSVSQLITQSTPPFRIVHANKAFSVFSGRAASEVIGRPIESIVQVGKDFLDVPPNDAEPAMFLGCLFQDADKSCQVAVTPIMDQSTDSKDGMSHLLIRISNSNNVGVPKLDPAISVISKASLKETLPVFGAVG